MTEPIAVQTAEWQPGVFVGDPTWITVRRTKGDGPPGLTFSYESLGGAHRITVFDTDRSTLLGSAVTFVGGDDYREVTSLELSLPEPTGDSYEVKVEAVPEPEPAPPSEREVLTALIHAPIEAAFDGAVPDWWPDHEQWAQDAADAIIAGGWHR